MRSVPSVFFAALLSLNINAQDKNLVLKPYWETKDARILNVSTETIYYRNDSVQKTVKGKFEGLIQIEERSTRDYTVTISQTYLPEYNNYNLFVANLLETNERIDLVVKLDKTGVPEELINVDELKELFIEGELRKIKAEKKGIKKADLESTRLTLEQEINTGTVFQDNVLAHASLLLNMYNEEFPPVGKVINDSGTLQFNRQGILPQPIGTVNEKATKELKGSKAVVSVVQKYEDIGQMALFRELIDNPDENPFGVPAVTDTYVTTFDIKGGWPQRKNEESVVVYGPYKVVTRFNIKFAKED